MHGIRKRLIRNGMEVVNVIHAKACPFGEQYNFRRNFDKRLIKARSNVR